MKSIFLTIFFLGLLSCSQKDISDKEIKNIVQTHYDNDPFFENVTVQVKLLKDLDPGYKGIIVNIKDSTYAYGFVNKILKKYIPFQEFKKHENYITHMSSWGINLIKTIDGKMTKEQQIYSAFLGIIPYKGF